MQILFECAARVLFYWHYSEFIIFIFSNLLCALLFYCCTTSLDGILAYVFFILDFHDYSSNRATKYLSRLICFKCKRHNVKHLIELKFYWTNLFVVYTYILFAGLQILHQTFPQYFHNLRWEFFSFSTISIPFLDLTFPYSVATWLYFVH